MRSSSSRGMGVVRWGDCIRDMEAVRRGARIIMDIITTIIIRDMGRDRGAGAGAVGLIPMVAIKGIDCFNGFESYGWVDRRQDRF